MKLGSIYAKKNKKAINIIPNTKENYITMSVNVVVDQYEQQYDVSRCKEYGEIYKNEILDKCKICDSETRIRKKGNIYDILMEVRFIDTFRFMNKSLDSLVKNLLNVNNCCCSHCNSNQEIKNMKLLPINKHNVLEMIAICNKRVSKSVDYSKFKTMLKRFKKEDLHLVLQKGSYPYEWVDSYDKMYELYQTLKKSGNQL